MRNCPFCKKTIAENDDNCPYCHRILVERIYFDSPSHTQNNINQNTKISVVKKIKDYFKKISDKLKKLRLNNFKKYIPILSLLLLIIFVSINKEKNNTQITHKIPPISVIPKSEISDNSTALTKNARDYYSLSNGTILSQISSYFNGPGELKIDNGTSLDAIAKLVNTKTNKSIITVYIKANSTYTIKDVSDDNYKLFFNLGNDWNEDIKAFAINSSYEVFEEDFNFVTEEDVNGYQYSTFRVTLNPIVGGQAKTENINAIEFGNY